MSWDGARLALSWLTVLPGGAARVDARSARQAIAMAPVVGGVIGAVAAGVGVGLQRAGAPPLLAGLVAVAALLLGTRGMHVDGLADTVDGLGCYGPPERALAVMRDGGAGPFAVAALVVLLGAQAVSIGALTASGRWMAVIVACACGRAAFGWCCRRGYPAARPEGMGALVAGTQPVWLPVCWLLALGTASAWATPHRYLGPTAVLAGAAVVVLLAVHVRTRLGGVTGDVLGAASELATTTVLAISTLR